MFGFMRGGPPRRPEPPPLPSTVKRFESSSREKGKTINTDKKEPGQSTAAILPKAPSQREEKVNPPAQTEDPARESLERQITYIQRRLRHPMLSEAEQRTLRNLKKSLENQLNADDESRSSGKRRLSKM